MDDTMKFTGADGEALNMFVLLRIVFCWTSLLRANI